MGWNTLEIILQKNYSKKSTKLSSKTFTIVHPELRSFDYRRQQNLHLPDDTPADPFEPFPILPDDAHIKPLYSQPCKMYEPKLLPDHCWHQLLSLPTAGNMSCMFYTGENCIQKLFFFTFPARVSFSFVCLIRHRILETFLKWKDCTFDTVFHDEGITRFAYQFHWKIRYFSGQSHKQSDSTTCPDTRNRMWDESEIFTWKLCTACTGLTTLIRKSTRINLKTSPQRRLDVSCFLCVTYWLFKQMTFGLIDLSV